MNNCPLSVFWSCRIARCVRGGSIAKISVYKHDVISYHVDQNHSCEWLAEELSSRSNHRRISNTIFGRCQYSNFLQTLTVKHFHNILTFSRVALEPILFTSNFWRAKNWQKFRRFQILAVVALDEHVLTKTSPIDMYVTRSTELTLRRLFSTLHVLGSPLSSSAWFSALNWTSSFRSACLRLCCCLHHLRSKKIVLLKPSFQIVASNQIEETSHKDLNKNAACVLRFHHEKRQMDRVKKWPSCHSTPQTALAVESYLSRRNFINTFEKIWQVNG